MEELKNERLHPFCVISIDTFGDHQVHDIQTNTRWTENPYAEGYVVVPDEMVVGIKATKGYCDIIVNEDKGELISYTARKIPAKTPKLTTQDDLLAMMVDHEFRITLMEVEMGVE